MGSQDITKVFKIKGY